MAERRFAYEIGGVTFVCADNAQALSQSGACVRFDLGQRHETDRRTRFGEHGTLFVFEHSSAKRVPLPRRSIHPSAINRPGRAGDVGEVGMRLVPIDQRNPMKGTRNKTETRPLRFRDMSPS